MEGPQYSSFFGVTVKPGQPTKIEGEPGTIFHISQACLNDPKNNGKTYLKFHLGERIINLACLIKDGIEHSSLDFFFSSEEEVAFSVDGKNSVDIVGYQEPQDMGDEDESDEEHDSEIDYDEVDLDEMDLDSDMEEEEEEVAPVPVPTKRPAITSGNTTAVSTPAAKKAVSANATPVAKETVAKTTVATGSSDDAMYEKALKDFLIANGKSDTALLGNKVKRPSSCAKLSAFIAARPNVFKVEGKLINLA